MHGMQNAFELMELLAPLPPLSGGLILDGTPAPFRIIDILLFRRQRQGCGNLPANHSIDYTYVEPRSNDKAEAVLVVETETAPANLIVFRPLSNGRPSRPRMDARGPRHGRICRRAPPRYGNVSAPRAPGGRNRQWSSRLSQVCGGPHWLNQPQHVRATVPTLLLTAPSPTFDGQRVQLDSWRGKPILVNFWRPGVSS